MDDGLSNIRTQPFSPYTQYRDSDSGIAMIGKILLAVDGSDNNKKAADEAVALAKGLGASLSAVYVTSSAEIRPNAFGGDAGAQERAAIVEKESKEAFAYVSKAAAAAGIELNCILLSGQAGTEIVKLTPDYDLIVCGSLGRTGLSRMLMGSVSSAIVKYSECPVMITRRSFACHKCQGPRPWPIICHLPCPAFALRAWKNQLYPNMVEGIAANVVQRLGRMLPKPLTRVRIPAFALIFHINIPEWRSSAVHAR